MEIARTTIVSWHSLIDTSNETDITTFYKRATFSWSIHSQTGKKNYIC